MASTTPADTTPTDANALVLSSQTPRCPNRLRPVTTRPLFQATSTVQLATVTLDALQAHRALLTRADTLHGDVNINTVLIVEFSSSAPSGSSPSSVFSFSHGADSTSCFTVRAPSPAADSESPSTGLTSHGALVDFDLPIDMPGSKPRAVRRPHYFRPPGVDA